MKATFITAALAVFASAVWWAAEGRLSAQDEARLQIEGTETSAEATVSEEGVEVLTRGPVHEAFAEAVSLTANETLVIDQDPPEPIEELPPDQKPEGENVIWIPGYWAWDDERSDFLWISGVWRAAPPNQEWVPGYWSQDESGGNFWTPGFWVSAELEEVAYLPEPPETLEEGPTSEPPTENHIWVPGVWRYQETRYVWRPGYYFEAQPEWVWVPAHYTWCPSGYVFVDGYWDYPLVRRGVLFAPVYYTQPIYRRPSYYYSPSIVINTNILTVHLFTRPRYHHYYFGDYYGDRWAEFGIRPWYHYHRDRVVYDPIFTYYSWREGRRDRDWYRNLERRHDYFERNRDARPPHRYADYRRRDRGDRTNIDIDINNTNITNITNVSLATTLNQFAKQEVNVRDNDRRMRFETVDNDRREQIQERARDIRQFAQQRSKVETEARTTAKTDAKAGASDRQDRRQRQTLNLADRPRARAIDRRADGETAAGSPPAKPGEVAGQDRKGRYRARSRDTATTKPDTGETGTAKPGETATTDAAGQDDGRGDRKGRDRARSRDTATTTPGTTEAGAANPGATATSDTAGQQGDRKGRDRARSRDTATTTPGASDTGTTAPAASDTATPETGSAARTARERAQRARDAARGETTPGASGAAGTPRTGEGVTRGTRRSADRTDRANVVEDRLDVQRGSLDTPRGQTGRSADRSPRANALEDRLDVGRGALDTDAGRTRRPTAGAGGASSGRQALDPGAQRPGVEDPRTLRNSDVRGEDDLENRRLYGTDRENRVARPGRDDRAGARGTTEAGGTNSADRNSGGAALPGIRQPRDAGAPNSDLDRLRSRRPSDVRREGNTLNEDRRDFDRRNELSRPGRDSRGPGGSAPAPDSPRNRLDLPDSSSGASRILQQRERERSAEAARSADRSTQRALQQLQRSRETSGGAVERRALRPVEQPSRDRDASRSRSPDSSALRSLQQGQQRDRGAEAARSAARSAERASAARSAERSRDAARSAQRAGAERASAAARSAERSRSSERSAERGSDRGRSDRGRDQDRGGDRKSDRKGKDRD